MSNALAIAPNTAIFGRSDRKYCPTRSRSRSRKKSTLLFIGSALPSLLEHRSGFGCYLRSNERDGVRLDLPVEKPTAVAPPTGCYFRNTHNLAEFYRELSGTQCAD